MTTKTKEIARKKESFLQTTQVQMNQWRDELDRLEEEIKQLPIDIQAEYCEQSANLRETWQQVEAKLQVLEGAASDQWEEMKSRWQHTSQEYRESFMGTANQLQNKEKVPLGWLQGFTDKRTHESAGWAEGMGKRPEGSEGWVEGMGKRPSGSKGWAEGYDRS